MELDPPTVEAELTPSALDVPPVGVLVVFADVLGHVGSDLVLDKPIKPLGERANPRRVHRDHRQEFDVAVVSVDVATGRAAPPAVLDQSSRLSATMFCHSIGPPPSECHLVVNVTGGIE
jgi:hypothetical protein